MTFKGINHVGIGEELSQRGARQWGGLSESVPDISEEEQGVGAGEQSN